MKWLVIGNTGQVGWELEQLLSARGDVIGIDYPDIDLRNLDALRSQVIRMKPRVIFNAAAYTSVDKAETEPQVAMSVNATAPKILAETANEIGAGLVHYSTDYVYDGRKDSPYTEEDVPNPQSVYGRSKAEGDAGIQAVGGQYAILRTSWVYGSRGKNFLLTILRLGRERSELRVVSDQVGSPTWCRSIAEVSVEVAQQMLDGSWKSGIYNCSNAGHTSWYGFAKEIFRQREFVTGESSPKLVPINTEDYPLPAPRPKNSRLCMQKLTRQTGLSIPSWEVSLHSVVREIPGESL